MDGHICSYCEKANILEYISTIISFRRTVYSYVNTIKGQYL